MIKSDKHNHLWSVTAKKEHIKCAHIEAGLRLGDMDMPEEINRLVTDRLLELKAKSGQLRACCLLRDNC
jgi:UDP-N-acetylglucosamine 2-epimerase (non-hydrolysing)